MDFLKSDLKKGIIGLKFFQSYQKKKEFPEYGVGVKIKQKKI